MTNMQDTQPVKAGGFKSVMDFKSPRTPLAAFGFYAFHFVVALLLCGLAGMIMVMALGVTDTEAAYNLGMRSGRIIGFIYATGIYVAILSARKLWKELWYVAGLLGVVILAIFSGVIGLIPSAVVMARKPKETP